jgi:hypothetical protein
MLTSDGSWADPGTVTFGVRADEILNLAARNKADIKGMLADPKHPGWQKLS